MANFKIVPYEVDHGDEIIEFGMNDKYFNGKNFIRLKQLDHLTSEGLLDDNLFWNK